MIEFEVRKEKGGWVSRRTDARRASVVAATQHEVVAATRGIAERAGEGRISIFGRDGILRQSYVVQPEQRRLAA